jgi:cell division protein FtsB
VKRKKGRKSRREKTKFSFVRLLLFLIVTSAVTLLLAYPAYSDWRKQKETYKRLQRELVELREQNQALRSEVELLEDPAYVEKMAREKLGLVKPGEKAWIVVEPEEETSFNASSPKPEELSWWEKFKVWLRKKLLE